MGRCRTLGPSARATSIPDLISFCNAGRDRQPQARLDRALDGLDIVQLHRDHDGDAAGAQESVNQPTRGNVAVEGDEALPAQAHRGGTRSARQRVPRRAGEDQLVRPQRHELELRPAGGDGHDAQVDGAVQARLVDLVGAAVQEAQVDLGMGAEEGLHGGGQRVQADAGHRGDGHRAGQDIGAVAQPLLDESKPLQRRLRLGVEDLPGLRHAEGAPGRAVEQAAFVTALQRAQLLADRRLGDEVQPRRPREAARLDQVAEGLQGLDSH